MKTLLAAALTFALAPLGAQSLTFNFDKLAAKAKAKHEVTLDGELLRSFAEGMKLPLSSLRGVVVRHYEFEKSGEYSDADLGDLRKQASTAGWTRLIHVKEPKESIDVYAFKQGEAISGFLLIAAEDRELSVVHIDGTLQLPQLLAVVQSTIQYDISNLISDGK